MAGKGQSHKKGNSEQRAVLAHYERLLLIRRCEERLMTLFANGEVPGFIHLSIGQEAVSVGVMSALESGDTIASTHRGHGHAIAKGIPLDGFFAELLAKDSGVCRGRGGSMHVADMRVGMLGANGIVAAGLPIAVGNALAHRARGTRNIAVCFFGDGALAEGIVHEAINIAALWTLPILFVCEANGWSEFSPASSQISFDLKNWARSFGLEYRRVDGNDVLAVAATALELVDRLRNGGSPGLLECVTTRVRGHYEGDAQKYRSADETETARDPLTVAARHLERLGVNSPLIEEIAARVEREIEAAISKARMAPAAKWEDALADVYSAGTL